MITLTRGDRICLWIERFCVDPGNGRSVRLSIPDSMALRRAYNDDDWSKLPVDGPLAPYLALLHLCGPAALQPNPPPIKVDPWSVWRAAGDRTREVLRRHG
jgi:hypothetical protein